MFKGILLSKENDQFSARVTDIDEAQLPPGDVTIKVAYSTLNYKDGLAITNKGPVVRNWPMVAGIDGVGTVSASESPAVKPGDQVILNGFGVGEVHWGCLAHTTRLKSDWLIKLPAAISAKRAMAIGTAGYTAMLCVLALQDAGVTPDKGEILVTGATGGVGSVALILLGALGYKTAASTGKASEHAYLQSLGASEIIDRATLSAPGKPLQKERWAGVVDSVGSHTLANACAQTKYGGVVTACGLAQGMDLPASVAPFILRSVRLQGIDSVMAPRALRERAWAALAQHMDMQKLDAITTEITLAQAISYAQDLMAGKVKGRIVVNVN
ncbi:MAG: MDR family oxidoreductase [Burkholderiaceae bacterium]